MTVAGILVRLTSEVSRPVGHACRKALRVETVNMARCVPDSLRFIRRPSTSRARFHIMTRPTRSYASFQALYLWATLAISAWHVL